MDKVTKVILCVIPTTICNLRCGYCYIAQRLEHYQGEQACFRYSPEETAKAYTQQRLGGPCYFNFCGEGETLLTKEIDKYIYEIVKEGHYVEIVTNMTVTPMVNKILAWEKELLERVTFKCSFHYLELLRRGLLEVFAQNVKNAWASGASANVEITPDDALIPHIQDVMAFSMEHFGALPHLTIARDDNNRHDYLTALSPEEYERTWSVFDSGFWRFKRQIFNVRRGEFCYAGMWSLFVDFATGAASQCYCSRIGQNIYDDLSSPIHFEPIGKCLDSHCYNGHALLTLGLIPGCTAVRYGDIRDRVRRDGSHWIQPQMLAFLNSKLEQTQKPYSSLQKGVFRGKLFARRAAASMKRRIFKV